MSNSPGGLVRVLAAVIRKDDSYLICRRPAHKRHGGLWEFPGGKIERGESDLDAARRELAEELAVNVVSVGKSLFSIQDPGSAFVIEFVPTEIAGDPECLEHQELRWTSANELQNFDLAPSDRRFAEVLRGAATVES